MSMVARAKAFVSSCRFVLLGLAVSLALHAALALGVLSVKRSKPPPQREELVVQLIGMASNRQIEQQQRGDDSPSSAQKVLAPTRKVPKKVVPVRKAPSPVKAKALPEKLETKSEPETEQQAAPSVSEQMMPTGAKAQQVQQTLKPRESEESLIRKYLAGLKQAIQNHLEYPQEARDTGYIGAPVIRFTITGSGDILSGSLSVAKSSGSALLDEKALQAARSAAPMAKPPRQMTVTITVAFTQDG